MSVKLASVWAKCVYPFRHMTNIILKKLCVVIPSLVPPPRLELGSSLLSITFYVWRVYQFLHEGILFEPMVGFEPTAYWLQISCTTIVLHWQNSEKIIQTVALTNLKKWLVHPDLNWRRNCQKVVCYRYTMDQLKNTITIVAEAGLEPARSLLTRRFSCHTCFYTSQLIALPLVFCLESTVVYTVVRRIKHSQK